MLHWLCFQVSRSLRFLPLDMSPWKMKTIWNSQLLEPPVQCFAGQRGLMKSPDRDACPVIWPPCVLEAAPALSPDPRAAWPGAFHNCTLILLELEAHPPQGADVSWWGAWLHWVDEMLPLQWSEFPQTQNSCSSKSPKTKILMNKY